MSVFENSLSNGSLLTFINLQLKMENVYWNFVQNSLRQTSKIKCNENFGALTYPLQGF